MSAVFPENLILPTRRANGRSLSMAAFGTHIADADWRRIQSQTKGTGERNSGATKRATPKNFTPFVPSGLACLLFGNATCATAPNCDARLGSSLGLRPARPGDRHGTAGICPEVAAEIVESLESALERFRSVAHSLRRNGISWSSPQALRFNRNGSRDNLPADARCGLRA
jgi:hypothetical protein